MEILNNVVDIVISSRERRSWVPAHIYCDDDGAAFIEGDSNAKQKVFVRNILPFDIKVAFSFAGRNPTTGGPANIQHGFVLKPGQFKIQTGYASNIPAAAVKARYGYKPMASAPGIIAISILPVGLTELVETAEAESETYICGQHNTPSFNLVNELLTVPHTIKVNVVPRVALELLGIEPIGEPSRECQTWQSRMTADPFNGTAPTKQQIFAKLRASQPTPSSPRGDLKSMLRNIFGPDVLIEEVDPTGADGLGNVFGMGNPRQRQSPFASDPTARRNGVPQRDDVPTGTH